MTDEESRLRHFPITLFAVIMGLTGLSIAFEKVYHLFGATPWLYRGLLILSTLLFLAFLVVYGEKWKNHPDAVAEEFFHPVRMHFFPAISISLLLLSIGYYPFIPILAIPLWFLGTLLHAGLTFFIFSYWIQHNFEIHHANPAWFIPIVGNVIIPIIGVDVVGNALSLFFFVVGIFFWLVMLTIVLYRIVFHHQLASKFIPTLFIMIAPPAVGFISYLRITQNLDVFAWSLLSIGIFFTLILAFMGKIFWRLPFFMSWWAFTFPLDAITIANLVAYQATGEAFFAATGLILLAITTSVIGAVSFATLAQAKRRAICIPEG